ncbi:MAG: SCO family protein, partial [Sediminibacterium sp.]|nr:SCO family protein [Sediminibacterium sp.]
LYVLIQHANYNQSIKLSTLSYVKPFSFIDQDGKKFTDKDMSGKIWVVSYFFTSCKGICPVLNKELKNLTVFFKADTNVKFLTHTCQPEKDSVPVLKKYSLVWGANPQQWIFLTGDKEELYKTARNSYLLDDPNNNLHKIEDDFIHTQFFALVDKEGTVRGQIYDALKPQEMAQLKKDIFTLENEKK